MAKFRKKPVVIEAVKFDGTPEGAVQVFEQFDIPGAKFQPNLTDLTRGSLMIPTLEGDHLASAGDYIIRGVKGEFYPCKPDIFAATYEMADGIADPWPRVDQFMSDADLTAAAQLIIDSADWSRLPKLAAIFQYRPAVNRYWHELVALTLLSLEVNGTVLAQRHDARESSDRETR
jgi:hypothetical protein